MSAKPEKNIIVKADDPTQPTSATIKIHLLTKSGEPLKFSRLSYVLHPAEDHLKVVDPNVDVDERCLQDPTPNMSITTRSKTPGFDVAHNTSIPGKYFLEIKDEKIDLQGLGVEFEIVEIKKDFSFDKGKSTIEIDHPKIYFTDTQATDKILPLNLK